MGWIKFARRSSRLSQCSPPPAAKLDVDAELDAKPRAPAVKAKLFESHLADGFQALTQQTDSDSSPCLSLGWLQQALGLLKESQSQMEALVPDLNNTLRDQDANWLRNCVADVEKLTQACDILKKSIGDVRYYQMHVQLALQCVERQQGDKAKRLLSSCMDALHDSSSSSKEREVSRLSLQRARLETSKKMLLNIVELRMATSGEAGMFPPGFQVADASDDTFFSMLYGLRVTGIFVLLVLSVSLMVNPGPPPAADDRNYDEAKFPVSKEPMWSASLFKLYRRVKEEVLRRNEKGPFAFLHELNRVDESVRNLHRILSSSSKNAGDDKALTESVQALRRCVDEVEAGLPPVEMHISEISKVLSSSRAVALEALTSQRSGKHN